MLDEITATYETFAREIAKREHLLVVIPKDEAPSTRLSPLTTHLSPLRSNDTWARDHGFITLSDDKGHLRLLDFRFNGSKVTARGLSSPPQAVCWRLIATSP